MKFTSREKDMMDSKPYAKPQSMRDALLETEEEKDMSDEGGVTRRANEWYASLQAEQCARIAKKAKKAASEEEDAPANKLAALKLIAEQYPINKEECVRRDAVPMPSLLESYKRLKVLEPEYALYKKAVELCIHMKYLDEDKLQAALVFVSHDNK